MSISRHGIPNTISGNLTIDGDLTITGDIIFGDAATDILTVTGYIQGSASGTTYVSIGTPGQDRFTGPTTSDLYVAGELEVDGTTYFDGAVRSWGSNIFYASNRYDDDSIIYLGPDIATGAVLVLNTDQTVDNLMFCPGTESNSIIICHHDDFTTDFGHTQQTDPTIYLHSSNDSDVDEYSSFTWSAWELSGDNGAFMAIKSVDEVVTIPVGQGAGGVDTSAKLVSDSSMVVGVTFFIVQAPGGGATTLDIGRKGGNTDEFIDGASCDGAGETGNFYDNHDIGTTGPVFNSTDVELTLTTDANVTLIDMQVQVVVYYFELIPNR